MQLSTFCQATDYSHEYRAGEKQLAIKFRIYMHKLRFSQEIMMVQEVLAIIDSPALTFCPGETAGM